MHYIDVIIIVLYVLLTLFIGVWISKRASKGLKDYFLGGNDIPWYFLGLSNGSGMFDVSGTAWMVGMLLLYGVKSFLFMWVWPVWNQVFVMMFLAVWIRRSNVMTGSGWILTRFGNDRSGRASHLVVAIFAIVAAVGFIAYFFEGVGKFMTIILPWDATLSIAGTTLLTSSQAYALILIFLTTIYTIKGGMFAVVATEVLQYGVMVLAGLLVASYAVVHFADVDLDTIVSERWRSLWFGWELETHWSSRYQAFNDLIDKQGYKMFGAFIGMSLFKGFFASVAGPTPSYDLQRILSTKNEKEAAYMSGFTNLVLFIPRYFLVAGIVLIALFAIVPEMNTSTLSSSQLEEILPKVINVHIPVGIKGLLLAGLLAAFMSTFSAFVNAGPAYMVNDIYKKYFKQNATDRHYIRASYVASFVIVFLGVLMGFFADSINSLTLWITAALFGGYIAANFLKWVWWRFNGWGYFWGMLSGLVVATLQFLLGQYADTFTPDTLLYELAHVPALSFFWIIFACSFVGSLLGTFCTPPTDTPTLQSFYKNVRPWGFWKPIREQLLASGQQVEKNKDFLLDMFNCLVGIVWQSAMILIPIYLMFRDYGNAAIVVVVFLLTSLFLKYTWFDRIKSF